MIARATTMQYISDEPTEATASVQTVDSFVRYIQGKNTKLLCSCVDNIDSFIAPGQQPSQRALQLLMDEDTAQQWQQDMLQLQEKLQQRFDVQPSTTVQALGPYQEVVRTARDLRNSIATRKQRIQQALLGQLKRARANTKDISAVQGVQLTKGFYL